MTPLATLDFWVLERHAERTALIDEHSQAVSYATLAQAADAAVAGLPPRSVFALLCAPTRATVQVYLGALRSGHVPLLLDADLAADARDRLLAHHGITAWFDGAQGRWSDTLTGGPPAHAELGLLLSTSGSTASPKLVRLSRANVAANAGSIVAYMGLHAEDVAITTLPLNYSYGLSILNTHLGCGACTVLTNAPVTQADFWRLLREHRVTSLSGVPTLWRLLRRLRFERMALPALRLLTQAGGRLEPEEQQWLLDAAGGRSVFVMYGQTEASARIAYVPPALLAAKLGSIGVAIPGGSLRVLDSQGQPLATGCEGELAYRGPNVMLGYAEGAADLARGPDTEELMTGDLGHVDADGIFWVTGRLKRFIKVYGHRISLDEIERSLHARGLDAGVVGRDDHLLVAVAGATAAACATLAADLARQFRWQPAAVSVRGVDSLPLGSNGKPLYGQLLAQLQAAPQPAPPAAPQTAEAAGGR